jgi:hypothetical protein
VSSESENVIGGVSTSQTGTLIDGSSTSITKAVIGEGSLSQSEASSPRSISSPQSDLPSSPSSLSQSTREASHKLPDESPAVPDTNPSSSSSSQVGMILGVVFGVLAVIAISVIVWLMLMMRDDDDDESGMPAYETELEMKELTVESGDFEFMGDAEDPISDAMEDDLVWGDAFGGEDAEEDMSEGEAEAEGFDFIRGSGNGAVGGLQGGYHMGASPVVEDDVIE